MGRGRMSSRPALMAHQIEDISWILDVNRGLLGNEPGLGKSRSAIEAFDGGKNLIIAPNLVVAGGTWKDELDRWSDDPSKWTVATYTSLNMRAKTGRGSGTVPTNVLQDYVKGKWDAVVVDEAHYIKGRDTHWTKSVERITKRADAALFMTGTPMPNWAHELFMLLRVIYPEKAKPGEEFGSFWRWAHRWFELEPNEYNPDAAPTVGELWGHEPYCPIDCNHYRDFALQNLGDRFRRVLREDALDLPPLTQSTIQVPMSAGQKRTYNELKRDFMTVVDDTEILAWSQGAQNVLLDRVTTSEWLLGDRTGIPRGGKFDRLRYDLSSRSRPTLVLAHYRTSVAGCAAVARDLGASVGVVHGGISRARQGEAVRQFKEGKTDVLVGSLETLAEGLTLTVADMAIFVESSYKPSRNEQARYRIHRVGQTRPVTILDYVTPNTVDERKRKLLAAKTDQQMRVLTAAQFKELL